jgi:hypothetical protein
MRRTTTALRLGTLAGRSQRSCVWHPKADSPERYSMQAVVLGLQIVAILASTLFAGAAL